VGQQEEPRRHCDRGRGRERHQQHHVAPGGAPDADRPRDPRPEVRWV